MINRYVRTEAKLGLKPVDDEIMAQELDVSIKKVKLIRNLIVGIRSEEPTQSAEAYQKLATDPNQRTAKSPEDIVGFQLENEHVADMISKYLSDREQEILKIRYGLDDGEPQTLAEAGKRMGVSRERIRQIEKRALQKLNLMLSGRTKKS